MKLEVIAALLLTIFTLLTSMLFIFQRNLLYPAPKILEETPADRGLAYEEVNLEPSQGERTHAWFIPADNAKGVVIYAHGNGDNVGSSMTEAAFLHNLGYAVMLYDYGGYGLSSGSPSEQRIYADGRAVWKYITEMRGVPGNRIVLFGISLGGGVSCQLAKEVDAAALVLEGTYTSIPDVARLRFPLINFDRIVLDKFESAAKLPDISEPVLIYHSKNDGTVPFSQGEDLYAVANEPRKFVELQGKHAKGIHDEPDTYSAAWTSFIDPLFEGAEGLNFD